MTPQFGEWFSKSGEIRKMHLTKSDKESLFDISITDSYRTAQCMIYIDIQHDINLRERLPIHGSFTIRVKICSRYDYVQYSSGGFTS